MSEIELRVNGRMIRQSVETRVLLSDFLRHQLGLTGTHVGCEQGVCGACTVLVGEIAVRSCLMLAVQADGLEVRTVESLAEGKVLAASQKAFREHHGLQCGFCTPGFLMTIEAALQSDQEPAVEDLLSGNLCRCTGYQGIRAAVQDLFDQRRTARREDPSTQGEPVMEPALQIQDEPGTDAS